MLKGTRSKRRNLKRQTRRLRSRKQRGGNPEENKERASYKHWIDILFFGARDSTFSIPDRYRMDVMRGMAHFALEQLTSSDPEDKEIIYEAFEKWAGEPYKSNNDSDEEENNQNGGWGGPFRRC